jgi:hypothetical protein
LDIHRDNGFVILPEEQLYEEYGTSIDSDMGQLVMNLGHQGKDFLVR